MRQEIVVVEKDMDKKDACGVTASVWAWIAERQGDNRLRRAVSVETCRNGRIGNTGKDNRR